MVLCIGSFGLDTTRTPFRTVERVMGGSAVYFSAAASFFTKVTAVGVVGEDFPKEYITKLKEMEIDLSNLEIRNGKTFFFDSSFDHSMYHRIQNAIDFGVMAGYVPKISKNVQRHDFLFLATFPPLVQL